MYLYDICVCVCVYSFLLFLLLYPLSRRAREREIETESERCENIFQLIFMLLYMPELLMSKLEWEMPTMACCLMPNISNICGRGQELTTPMYVQLDSCYDLLLNYSIVCGFARALKAEEK